MSDTLTALKFLVVELEYAIDHPSMRFDPAAVLAASGARAAIAEAEEEDDEDEYPMDLEAQLEAAFFRR